MNVKRYALMIQIRIQVQKLHGYVPIKRRSLILLLLMVSGIIYSQTYHKFPKSADLPIWGVKQTIHDRMEETETISYFYYAMMGDTLIGDSTYNKIYRLRDTLINAQNIDSYECSLRESFDSCIYRISAGDSSVYKLFDYSLEENDTTWLDTDAGSMKYQLAEKIPISLNDELHTKYLGTFDPWIDGVGSTSKAIDWYELPKPAMIDYTYELKTFKLSDKLIYGVPFSDYLGTITSKHEQNRSGNIRIHPNPCKQHTNLIIENIYPSSRILIRTITGRIVFQQQKFENEIVKIDTRLFKKGLYVVSVCDKTGSISNYKITVF